MKFNELLDKYIKDIGCTSKELAESSNLSAANISRYRSGSRSPKNNTKQLEDLASGIYILSKKSNIEGLTKEYILESFNKSLPSQSINYDTIIEHLNQIICSLDINIADMSRALNYDASYISRIKSKKRIPTDLESFISNVCKYIVHKYTEDNDKHKIAALIGCDHKLLKSDNEYLTLLNHWFYIKKDYKNDTTVCDFLTKLDKFNLEEYIKSIHFDDIKIPTIPFNLSSVQKHYFGIDEFKKAELDFLKATVLSKSKESVYMCSDMPMTDMAEDKHFGKKWMFGLAVIIKKGLHLNVIHNINRPFNEMMLGLESWIPLYMTGQISPYYIKNPQNAVYSHLHYSSKDAALFGECISGHHDKGRYYLTRKKDEVNHFKELIKCLFQKSLPLMTIYKKENEKEFINFLSKDIKKEGNRRSILSSLPLHTISYELLDEILNNNSLSDESKNKIKAHVTNCKNSFNDIILQNTLVDEIPIITPEEFEKYPLILPLSDIFFENDVHYTYKQYEKHLNLTKQISKSYDNYDVKFLNNSVFRNIAITINEGKWVMISKNKFPAIHFVIYHPSLRYAIENMIITPYD